MTTLFQDLRYGLRMLVRSPQFTVVAVVTLALGIGANAVVFTGAYWVLFEPLPYPEADKLAVLYQIDKTGAETGVSYADFTEWKAAGDVFLKAGATCTQSMTLEDRDQAERIIAGLVSPEVMPMLGVGALLGRTFDRADFHPGSTTTVVVGRAFWQARLGGASDVIGRHITLNERDAVVIGVMPAGFSYPFRAEIWLPLDAWEAPARLSDSSSTRYEVLARLQPGVGLETAAARAELISSRISVRSATDRREQAVIAARLRDTLPGLAKYRATILVLQLASALVLVIACVNLANLLFARNIGRQQELAVRVALGGRPGRLVRLLLAESLLLALLGTTAGLLLAKWGVDALRAAIVWRPAGFPEVDLNLLVLLGMLSLGVMTSLIFGLAPARMAVRFDLCARLKSATGQATPEAHGQSWSRCLVVAEAAMAVVLLAVAGVTIRTLMELARYDPGFDAESAIVVSYTAPHTDDVSQEGLAAHYSEVLDRVRAVPGVTAAGGISCLPLIGYNPKVELEIEGRAIDGIRSRPLANFQGITPEYFSAMGIPIVTGRVFGAVDVRPHPEVVVVNRAFSNRYFPSQEAVGKRIQLRGEADAPGLLTIVGVVEDVRPYGQFVEPSPELYVPIYRRSMALVVRTRSRPAELVPAVNATVRSVARSRAAFRLTTMTQMMVERRERRWIFAWLLAGMSAIAIVLTALGIYGVVSHEVARRTREIGIRTALGADAPTILSLVFLKGLVLAGGGIICGAVGAWGMMRVMRSLPFRLQPLDPLTLGSVGLLVAIVALAACFVPARRAARIDPMKALRCE